MRVPFFLIADGCMDQVITQIEFILGNAGEFIFGHEISFEFDVPAKSFVCTGTAVIGSGGGAGKDRFFKAVNTDKVCGSGCKPDKKDEKEANENGFDKFDGIHGLLLYSGSCSMVKVMEKWQSSCTLDGYR